MKKILFTGLLISSMFFNVACDSDELAAGAIGVGVGIGLGGLNDGHNHDGRGDRYDRGGRYGRGDWDRGYGGGRYDGGYNRGCDQYRCYSAETNELQSLTADFATQTFAQKHNISVAAGNKIEKAFQNVSKSGLASFQAIGLNEKAVDKIMSRELPDDNSIKSMSQSLNITETHGRTMLQNLVAEFQAQVTDSSSNYWKSCQAKGQWKTPQNAFCSNASWNGCSPETGATLCY